MKNLLQGTRVYLAGVVEADPVGAVSWRQDITERLSKYDTQIYNPLVKPDWLPEYSRVDVQVYKDVLAGRQPKVEMDLPTVFEANLAVRRICLRMVSSCDWIICHMPKTFTAGTFEELYLAAQLEKPVLFHLPDGVPPTWVLPIFANANTMKETYFKTWDTLFEHIDKLNDGTMPMDPYKWLSVCYTPECLVK